MTHYAAGVMSANECEYGKLAPYYDLVQQQLVDYRAEAETMHGIFCNNGVHTVLDIACGTGAHVLELAKLGYQCVGIDLTSEMIQVAKKKSRAHDLAMEFLIGDMCAYQLDRKFDAVLGLYSLTSLISDGDFHAGLASARRAVWDGGFFYFNLLNVDFEGAEYVCREDNPPAFYVDVVVNEPDIRLVRLNQTVFHGDVQDWTAVYLIDEGRGVNVIMGNHKLRFHHLECVLQELERAGFRMKSVTYSDVQGLKRWDMFVLAQAV